MRNFQKTSSVSPAKSSDDNSLVPILRASPHSSDPQSFSLTASRSLAHELPCSDTCLLMGDAIVGGYGVYAVLTHAPSNASRKQLLTVGKCCIATWEEKFQQQHCLPGLKDRDLIWAFVTFSLSQLCCGHHWLLPLSCGR